MPQSCRWRARATRVGRDSKGQDRSGMDVETSTVETTTFAGVNEEETSKSAQAKVDAQPKAVANDVPMPGAPDSNVMPSQAGNLSHVSPSSASAPGKDMKSGHSTVPSSGVPSASLENAAPSVGPSASGAQSSSSKAAAPSQGAGISTSSAAVSSIKPSVQDTCAPVAFGNPVDPRRAPWSPAEPRRERRGP